MNSPKKHLHIGDNLTVMRKLKNNSIDLICTNPPFFKTSNRPVPRQLSTSITSLTKTWTRMVIPKSWESRISSEYRALYATICTIRWLHSIQLYNYLMFLTIRLIEMKRILNSTGSVFIHCGPTFSHYVKLCMDGIFGKDQFRNEIVWCYLGRGTTEGQKTFQRKHQIIFFYSVTDQYKFLRDKASRLVNDRRTFMNPLGVDFAQVAVDDSRLTDQILIEDWWPLPPARGNRLVGFPNRKPRKLYRTIIESFSEEGDVVLDPFCGSGTICLEAARIDRQWIGIDAAEEARTLVPTRLETEVGMGELFTRLAVGPACIVDPPLRAD